MRSLGQRIIHDMMDEDEAADDEKTLHGWASSAQPVPVLDLRPDAAFMAGRLVNSCSIPLGRLHRRMFWLPPPMAPFGIIMPRESHYHVVTDEALVWTDEPDAACSTSGRDGPGQGDNVAAQKAKTSRMACPGPGCLHVGCSSRPVFIKGCSNLREFLSTRSWKGVQWFLQDSDDLWHTVRRMQLWEPAASSASDATRLRRRFLFWPCPLLHQYIEQMERELAERRCTRNAHGAGGSIAHSQPRKQLRLRCLEPGCGSGRNLAWLAARHSEVVLHDGSVVDVRWDVVGIDFWYGALVRMQELCLAVEFEPSQCVLHHCDIDMETGVLKPLNPPGETCKHHVVQRTHIQVPPNNGALPDGSFDLILCVRFLNRRMHKHVTKLLSPGGYVLVNTFLDMEGTRAFGRPSGTEHLLQPRELARDWFGGGHGFRVLCDGVEVEQPHGRELSLFLSSKI